MKGVHPTQLITHTKGKNFKKKKTWGFFLVMNCFARNHMRKMRKKSPFFKKKKRQESKGKKNKVKSAKKKTRLGYIIIFAV